MFSVDLFEKNESIASFNPAPICANSGKLSTLDWSPILLEIYPRTLIFPPYLNADISKLSLI